MPTRRRISRTLTSAALSLMMAGSLLALPSATLAGLPSWSNWITAADPTGSSPYADSLPGKVEPGYDAGFRVKIHNNGPSNISQLYLVASDAAPDPTYAKPSQGTCNATGALYCALGALRAGGDAYVIVAFATDAEATGQVRFDFEWNTTGAGSSTGGDNSHGDFLPQIGITDLSTDSTNFAGGFTSLGLGGAVPSVGNEPVGPGNAQQIIVTPPLNAGNDGLVATVEDALTGSSYCPEGGCIGEVSELHIGDGGTYDFFKVVIYISKSATSGLNANKLIIVHVNDAGVSETLSACPKHGAITTNCGSAANASGGLVQVTIWLNQNGYIKYH